jgi:RimJ/RimL family protein N-acetyltransferase
MITVQHTRNTLKSKGKLNMRADLFRGALVHLAARDPDTDAEAVARWERDSEFHRLAHNDPAYPILAKTAKQWLEEESPNGFRFAIRTLADDRLIGTIGLWVSSWTNGEAWAGISIGERDYWGNGYGTDAMKIILRYGFTELNLYRVSLDALASNARAVRAYEKAGFVVEGYTRGAAKYDGQHGDEIYMGILREEWAKTTA